MTARPPIPDILTPSHVKPVSYFAFVSIYARHPPDHPTLTVTVVAIVVNRKVVRQKHAYIYHTYHCTNTIICNGTQKWILRPRTSTVKRNIRYVHSDVRRLLCIAIAIATCTAPYSCIRYSKIGTHASGRRQPPRPSPNPKFVLEMGLDPSPVYCCNTVRRPTPSLMPSVEVRWRRLSLLRFGSTTVYS